MTTLVVGDDVLANGDGRDDEADGSLLIGHDATTSSPRNVAQHPNLAHFIPSTSGYYLKQV